MKEDARVLRPAKYRRTAPVRRAKLDGSTGLIDQWLRAVGDEPAKRRHTAILDHGRYPPRQIASAVCLAATGGLGDADTFLTGMMEGMVQHREASRARER